MRDLQITADIEFDTKGQQLILKGDWTVANVSQLRQSAFQLLSQLPESLIINGLQVTSIDTAGGLLAHHIIKDLHTKKIVTTDFKATSEIKQMLSLVTQKLANENLECEVLPKKSFFSFIGKQAENKFDQFKGVLSLVGELFVRLYHALLNWKRFHPKSIIRLMELVGLQALPILGLLAFLIGIVLTYQMGLQLKTYGANIYIVFITGMALQREFAPLITAIIVAGRTSSSFTAQIGSMKVNEEIDALTVMGLVPTELLVLPKMLAMLLVFPILIFWADLFGTLGAMFMSKMMLGVGYVEFLNRLKESLGVKQYLLGLVKGPFFALVIALVGCFQGFQVRGSANSVGLYTTKSVVQAIFLIIIVDAAFSIIFTCLEL